MLGIETAARSNAKITLATQSEFRSSEVGAYRYKVNIVENAMLSGTEAILLIRKFNNDDKRVRFTAVSAV